MKTFEYLSTNLIPPALAANGKPIDDKQPPLLNEQLNRHGREGWELRHCQTMMVPPSKVFGAPQIPMVMLSCVFIREIIQPKSSMGIMSPIG